MPPLLPAHAPSGKLYAWGECGKLYSRSFCSGVDATSAFMLTTPRLLAGRPGALPVGERSLAIVWTFGLSGGATKAGMHATPSLLAFRPATLPMREALVAVEAGGVTGLHAATSQWCRATVRAFGAGGETMWAPQVDGLPAEVTGASPPGIVAVGRVLNHVPTRRKVPLERAWHVAARRGLPRRWLRWWRQSRHHGRRCCLRQCSGQP
jgi:hypothetical protein